MFGRKNRDVSPDARVPSEETDRTLTPGIDGPSKAQIKRATRTRMTWALISSFFLLLTVVFLILVEVGSTGTGSVKASIYFININLTNIFPESVPDAAIINSIAQTIGLHDFYRVGLWGYCQGYNGQGITSCSKPETLYWFNPVQIIISQLLAGATSMYTHKCCLTPANMTLQSHYLRILPISSVLSELSRTGCLVSSSQVPAWPLS
jgi:hypothetical protein